MTERRSRSGRRTGAAAAAAVAAVLLSGVAAAAATGSLPAPVQHVAHRALGAPDHTHSAGLASARNEGDSSDASDNPDESLATPSVHVSFGEPAPELGSLAELERPCLRRPSRGQRRRLGCRPVPRVDRARRQREPQLRHRPVPEQPRRRLRAGARPTARQCWPHPTGTRLPPRPSASASAHGKGNGHQRQLERQRRKGGGNGKAKGKASASPSASSQPPSAGKEQGQAVPVELREQPRQRRRTATRTRNTSNPPTK